MLLGDFGQLEGFEPTQNKIKKKIKADLRKKKLKSAFFVYVEKIKPFLLLIHKRKSKIKNGFF